MLNSWGGGGSSRAPGVGVQVRKHVRRKPQTETHEYTEQYIHIYICIYIYIYTSRCIYIYVYMYREREREILGGWGGSRAPGVGIEVREHVRGARLLLLSTQDSHALLNTHTRESHIRQSRTRQSARRRGRQTCTTFATLSAQGIYTVQGVRLRVHSCRFKNNCFAEM